MALEGFICPDGKTVTVQDCLQKCRMEITCPICGGMGTDYCGVMTCNYCGGNGKVIERCLTLPTLKLLSQEREWNGVASTTQLLNGTMLEYLKLTKPYYVDPDSRAFMLAGTRHHKALSDVADELGLPAEVPLSIDRDIFDLMEVEDMGFVLTDNKLWGSFKVALALGIVKIGKRPDPSGAVYKTSGNWGKAGSPKMVNVFQQFPEKADNWEAEFQLNRYKVKIEKLLESINFKIHRLQVQATVRDGGLALATSRGVFKNIYKIPVRILHPQVVEDFFEYKDNCLKEALANGWDEPCNDKETWNGRRCRNHCEVAIHCPKGRMMLASKDKEEE